MKILVIHHTGLMGGGTLSCFDVIKSLSADGSDVYLLLPPGENEARKQAKKLNINVLNYNIKPLVFGYYNGSSNLIKVVVKSIISMKYINRWKLVLGKEKPDLVVLNSIVQWPMISIINKIDINTVCFIRETMKGNRYNIINYLIAFYLKRTSGVSFLSVFDREQWKISNLRNIQVIPDMLNMEKYTWNLSMEKSREKFQLKQNFFYVLYVGGMSKLKGAETIIKAINNCTSDNIRLLFLGDLGEKSLNKKNSSQKKFVNKMYRFIKENNLQNRIKLIGPQTNVNYWYAACDVVVFPAEEAHQGRPIYEAGAFKKPVIVSDFPNYKEYMQEGVNGLYFEPGNDKELTEKIENLKSDSEYCADLGTKNYFMTKELHSSISISKSIVNFVRNTKFDKEGYYAK